MQTYPACDAPGAGLAVAELEIPEDDKLAEGTVTIDESNDPAARAAVKDHRLALPAPHNE